MEEHHQSNGGMSNSSSSNHSSEWVSGAASQLIQQLDAALGDMNSSIVEGARDAEEARKNARRAAELARRFAAKTNAGGNSSNIDDDWDAPTQLSLHENGGPLQPPPAPSPPKQQPYMNGDATAVSTPSHNTSNNSSFPFSNNSARAHRLHKTAERLAQQHADELLQVTLELERTQQSLEAEQMAHDETRSALQQSKSKQHQLEHQVETLLNDMETARCDAGLRLDQLQDDLERARERVAEAEEDADLAYEIAKSKEAERAKMEEWLHRALSEIQGLREYIANSDQQQPETATEEDGTADCFHDYLPDQKTPTHGSSSSDGDNTTGSSAKPRRVRFQFDGEDGDNQETTTPAAASSANVGSSSTSSQQHRRPTSRSAMVAAGRQLLQQHRSQSPVSAEASAQRRRRLRSRLQGMILEGDDDNIADPDGLLAGLSSPASQNYSSSNKPKRPHGLGQAVEALDVCRHAAQVLKESGCRLHLTGRWWNDKSEDTNDDNDNNAQQRDHHDEIHLDTLARHYTAAVEVRRTQNSISIMLGRPHFQVQTLEKI